MKSQCISFSEIPDVNRFFSTFLENFPAVAAYYAHPPTVKGIDAAAREVRLEPEVRRKVVEVLKEQNRAFGADVSTKKNIERLAAGAVAIVTGQQVGLFSGPAYTLYKAISAFSGAEQLTERGIDAVPVFWMATEDHDLAEVNHTLWNAGTGLRRYELPLREGDEGKLVGSVQLGTAVDECIAAAAESLSGAFAGEIAGLLRESYSSRETYGSSFGKLLTRLLARQGIVLLDPMDARLHRLAAPVLRKAVEKAQPLEEALLERSRELEARGFRAQVNVTREMTLLFCQVQGRREPVHQRNGKLLIGNASFSPEEILAAIEERPEDFSPNALLRPVMQDMLLPTAAYIGGPAEVAYMAQAQIVYKQLLGRMPAIVPRASFTVVEPGMAELLSTYDLDIRDFFLGRQHLSAKMEERFLPPDLANRFDRDRARLCGLLESYTDPVKKLDPTLLGVIESVKQNMLDQFEKLRGKVSRVESLRTGLLDAQEEILLNSLYPNKRLQERILCPLPLLAEYGLGFLEVLTRASGRLGSPDDSVCAQHHVLVLKQGEAN